MLVSFGLLVVIALFTALIGPYFVDWTAYKKDFEVQASRIIGQNVRVGGEAQVRLLPLPSLSFSDLAVGENADGTPMLTVEQFSANVELMPFLSGEVRIVDMTLDTPKFDFDVDNNGKIAWTKREQPLVDPGQVELDKLTVRNGGFTIGGLSEGREIVGSVINAEISATSLFGPWRIQGAGNIEGQATKFDISTGTYSADNPLRLKVSTSRGKQPYGLMADGQVSLVEDVLAWSGEFSIDPIESDLPKLRGVERIEPLPVRTEGVFGLTPTNLVVPQYRTEIGHSGDPFVLTGKGQALLRGKTGFRLEIDGRQIDVERIARMRDGEGARVETMESRLALLRSIVDQVPIPDIEGEIDLEIPAIIAGKTHIREISALLKPIGNSWEIARLKASLPGNTLVEGGGRLGTGDDFGFHGKLLVASRQPSGFAAWAVGRVDPSIRKLNVAGFAADVTLTSYQTSLEQLELFLNKNRLSGSINRLAAHEDKNGGVGNPAIVAKLEGDRVSLEDLRTIVSLVIGSESQQVDSLALTHDFDIALKADHFSGLDIEAKDIDTQFRYHDSELSVARLNIGDLFGANIQSTGQIENLLNAPKGNLNLALSADNLSDLAGFVAERFGEDAILSALRKDPALSTNTRLKIEVDSSVIDAGSRKGSNNRVIANGTVGGTKVQLRGGIKGSFSDHQALWMDLSGELASENTNELAAQLGLRQLGYTEIYGGLEGQAKVGLESVGDQISGFSTLINVAVPGMIISAKGLVKPGSENIAAEFSFTAGSDNISPVAAAFGQLLPRMNAMLGDEVPLSMSAHVSSNGEDGLDLKIEKANLAGNAVSGFVSLENLKAAPVSIRGDLKFDEISYPLVAGGLLGFDSTLLETGGFILANAPVFSGPAISGVKGRLSVSADKLSFSSGDKAEGVSFDLDHSLEKTEVSNLLMNWMGGLVSGGGVIGRIDGTVTLAGQYSASGLTIADVLTKFGALSFAEGRAALSGTIEATGKTPAAFVQSLSGSGVLSYNHAQLVGIGPTGLEGILEVTDAEEFEITDESIAPLADAAFLNGAFVLRDGSVPFSLRNGEFRLRNINLADAGKSSLGPALGDLSYALPTGETDAKLTIFPDPGANAVSGATPEITYTWSGPIGSLVRNSETSALQGYLSIRAFEAEQRRVELLQAAILEKRRFRRDLLNSGERGRWLQVKRLAELRRIEEERKAAEEAARLEAERIAKEEAERKAQEEAERLAKQQQAERLAAETSRLEALRKTEKELEAQRLNQDMLNSYKRQARATTRSPEIDNRPGDAKPPPSAPTPNAAQPREGNLQPNSTGNMLKNIEDLILQPSIQ